MLERHRRSDRPGFNRKGHRVYATARRIETLAPFEREGIRGLELDVNDDTSIAGAFETVAAEAGHLDLLVNNAGFSQVGAVVDLTRDDLRRQYETNVIAPVMVTAKAVPLLRAAVAKNGSAVVANVGSIVGLFTTPFAAAYCSSKAAVHSLTDALRMELAPFGIHVVSIQPGGIRSSFGIMRKKRFAFPRIRFTRSRSTASAPARRRASKAPRRPTSLSCRSCKRCSVRRRRG